MKSLLTLAFGLAMFFACTFLIIKGTGVLSVDDIKVFLIRAHDSASLYVAMIIIALLVADLFIAVPTLTVTLLSGYFLGFPMGFAVGVTGLMTAGLLGYGLSYTYGPSLLRRIQKDDAKRAEMTEIFARYGVVVLVICRALPILPEVTCCLAGATRMRFPKFLAAFMLGTVPYAAIATYAGSRSSLADPTPAIVAAIALSAVFAGLWLLLLRHHKTQKHAQ
jgi:uncharacterized membrane protein YdjX (TVP38/TMEM64 family)